jgi:hypothetical protein
MLRADNGFWPLGGERLLWRRSVAYPRFHGDCTDQKQRFGCQRGRRVKLAVISVQSPSPWNGRRYRF